MNQDSGYPQQAGICVDLSGKVALVTGSSRGIGRAVALLLSDAGATVALNATRDASETQAAIESTGGACSVHIADVSEPNQAATMVQEVIDRHGALDFLVNNAGVNHDTLVLRMSDEDWRHVIEVNLTGVFNCTRAALKHMVRRRSGRIVNMGSVVGYRGNAGQANYSATKSGLIGMTRSVALEVGSRGITANIVTPGYIETEMTSEVAEGTREAIRSAIPMGRFGTPEDVAQAVLFLCSDEAGYINGQVLPVDGGLVLV